ncbi:hypothetical protein [Nostoc sp.]
MLHWIILSNTERSQFGFHIFPFLSTVEVFFFLNISQVKTRLAAIDAK